MFFITLRHNMSDGFTYSVVSEIYRPTVPLNVVLRCYKNRLHSNEPS